MLLFFFAAADVVGCSCKDNNSILSHFLVFLFFGGDHMVHMVPRKTISFGVNAASNDGVHCTVNMYMCFSHMQ